MHEPAAKAIRGLAESPAPWAICFHCLVEFYAVATLTRLWRIPSTPEQAIDQIRAWRESPSLRILCDTPRDLDALADLALTGKIRGGQVHDARIAACCLNHGVRELWSIDRNFSRFPALRTRNPLV